MQLFIFVLLFTSRNTSALMTLLQAYTNSFFNVEINYAESRTFNPPEFSLNSLTTDAKMGSSFVNSQNPRSSCDLINSRYVWSISNFCTKCWLSDSNGWYRDVLSQTFCLAFSGQNVLAWDRKAYLCFSYPLSNGHRLRDTGWLIRPGWFSRWRNLCVQQKIRTSVRFCL